MSDEEYFKLKRQIIELGDMCYKFNYHFRELQNEMSDLDKSLSDFESDLFKLKSDLTTIHKNSRNDTKA